MIKKPRFHDNSKEKRNISSVKLTRETCVSSYFRRTEATEHISNQRQWITSLSPGSWGVLNTVSYWGLSLEVQTLTFQIQYVVPGPASFFSGANKNFIEDHLKNVLIYLP